MNTLKQQLTRVGFTPEQIIIIVTYVQRFLEKKRPVILKMNFPSNDSYAVNRFIDECLEDLTS